MLGQWLYRTGLGLYGFGVRLAALRHEKARLWLEGRKDVFDKVASLPKAPKRIWFHAASLGEFEQGRPMIEEIKSLYPDYQIILSFFSPSGYEIRKNYPFADLVLYLPLDSPDHARKWVKMLRPDVAIFIKYEFWYYYFKELYKGEVPLIMLSSVFHKGQPFFKFWGGLHRSMLAYVRHFFVQDEKSKHLLNSLGFSNTTVVPDTRIDRVWEIARLAEPVPEIEVFTMGKPAVIGGSIYKAENDMLYEAWKARVLQAKVILVPHNVDEAHLQEIAQPWGSRLIRFSELKDAFHPGADVLLVDTIGLLSRIYRYGQIAIIGGGFGKSIHNILEPAAHGLPVLMGPKHGKFAEGKALIEAGGAFEFTDTASLISALKKLMDERERMNAAQAAKAFIQHNTGGTDAVLGWLHREKLLP